MVEFIEDIPGSRHIHLDYGDRFIGWYLTERFLKSEDIPLGINELTVKVNTFDYNYRFILPSKIDFKGGIISYSEAERMLGVFRYPQAEDGTFCSPLSVKKTEENFLNLSPEELENLLKNRKVLTFEAFRIPQFGFKFPKILESEYEVFSCVAQPNVVQGFRASYEAELIKRIEVVKEKICGQPNFLLILKNVLDGYYKNFKEVFEMTGGLIYI